MIVEALIGRLARELAPVPGISAIVLGGSRARGFARADSDIDIGLLYRDQNPIDLAALRSVVAGLDDRGAVEVSEPYAWGPWVNGGCWLVVGGQRVDLMYRSVDRLEAVIGAAVDHGTLEHHYGQQPPAGYFSVTYLGEVACARVLHDPEGAFAGLRARLGSAYPPRLAVTITENLLWQVEFTLFKVRDWAARGDVYLTVGSLVRCATYLNQVLFALNGAYFVSDKSAAQEIAAFPRRPQDYVERVAAILAHPGADVAALTDSVTRMRTLWRETVPLVPSYLPRAVLPPTAGNE